MPRGVRHLAGLTLKAAQERHLEVSRTLRVVFSNANAPKGEALDMERGKVLMNKVLLLRH